MRSTFISALLVCSLAALCSAHGHTGFLLPRVETSWGDLSLGTSNFNVSNLYQVYFDFDETNITATIIFNLPLQYFALGFGDGMSDVDMWVFQINGTEVTAGDYWSITEQPPNTDLSVGGVENLELLGYAILPTSTLVRFTRSLNTGDQYDYVLNQGNVSMIYATHPGSPQLTYHASHKGFFTAPFIQGYQGEAFYDERLFA